MSEATAPVVPRHASSVVLLRDRDRGGVETFILRRPPRSSFAAAAHVFCGGTVDAEDSDAAVLRQAPDFHASALLSRLRLDDDAASLALCAGLYVAAVREVFEESGILIGSDGTGDALTSADAPRLRQAREQLLGGIAFADVLSEHRLQIAPQRLTYIAHFVTPIGLPKRFDTRFFVVAAPIDQEAAVHGGEATDGDWYAPRELLDEHRGNLETLMPPTRIICNELARHRTTQDVIDDLGARPVARILFEPRAVLSGNIPEWLPRVGDVMTS